MTMNIQKQQWQPAKFSPKKKENSALSAGSIPPSPFRGA